ncbi:MAG TPA: hypothetical protein VFQ39_15550, partial [Longimicrobium sp.]|nr:hypothetical protein [Longimicrobium sp.]
MHWKPEVGIGDILTSLGFLLTTIGLAFAIIQLRQNALERRAQFLLDLTDRYFSDIEVRRFYYRLDYNQFRLD